LAKTKHTTPPGKEQISPENQPETSLPTIIFSGDILVFDRVQNELVGHQPGRNEPSGGQEEFSNPYPILVASMGLTGIFTYIYHTNQQKT